MLSLLAPLFVIFFIAIDIAIQRQILMPSFAELERDDARTSMRRISYALDMTLDELELTAADWGNWADVYDYAQRPNGAFVSTNITPVAMKQLQVNALLICDMHGNLVLSTAQDFVSGKSINLDLANRKALPDDFPWRRNLTDGKSAKGLIEPIAG